MAYLRWEEKLPSGDLSKSFVFGDPDGLINIDKSNRILYSELKVLLKQGDNIEKELGLRLDLSGEELEVVCERLLYEKSMGEWD